MDCGGVLLFRISPPPPLTPERRQQQTEPNRTKQQPKTTSVISAHAHTHIRTARPTHARTYARTPRAYGRRQNRPLHICATCARDAYLCEDRRRCFLLCGCCVVVLVVVVVVAAVTGPVISMMDINVLLLDKHTHKLARACARKTQTNAVTHTDTGWHPMKVGVM